MGAVLPLLLSRDLLQRQFLRSTTSGTDEFPSAIWERARIKYWRVYPDGSCEETLYMEGKYRNERFNVVEADLLPEAMQEVREKLNYLCANCLPNNIDALNRLFSERQLTRCYTFLPEDMSKELRQSILAQEHCSWGAEYFSKEAVFQQSNIEYIPMTWRYVSQDCLKSKMLEYLNRDTKNICALGEYSITLIEKDSVDKYGIFKIGDMLCFKKDALNEPIPMVLDSVYFDSFGFMGQFPLRTVESDNHEVDTITDIYADKIIRTASHVFINIHKEEGICVLDFD